jgi:hypothetical protein
MAVSYIVIANDKSSRMCREYWYIKARKESGLLSVRNSVSFSAGCDEIKPYFFPLGEILRKFWLYTIELLKGKCFVAIRY